MKTLISNLILLSVVSFVLPGMASSSLDGKWQMTECRSVSGQIVMAPEPIAEFPPQDLEITSRGNLEKVWIKYNLSGWGYPHDWVFDAINGPGYVSSSCNGSDYPMPICNGKTFGLERNTFVNGALQQSYYSCGKDKSCRNPKLWMNTSIQQVDANTLKLVSWKSSPANAITCTIRK